MSCVWSGLEPKTYRRTDSRVLIFSFTASIHRSSSPAYYVPVDVPLNQVSLSKWLEIQSNPLQKPLVNTSIPGGIN
ncbi:hypothetical protein L1987_32586 [Smallanthus sonchifolius]|uniref:Uncharacterized protein n=1 Tax=Smallanthus sonchifolius TaxID=185202 RepID=A0ACB9HQC7_9ASTR|nr:hypothetical protein L1987_32586 [Smallanthus sonchifolius]